MKIPYRLGRPLSEFRCKGVGKTAWLITAISGSIALGSLLMFASIRIFNDYTKYSLSFAFANNLIYLILAGFCALSFSILALFLTAYSRSFATVHNKGIRVRNGFSQVVYLHWHQISGIAQSIIQEHFLHLPIRKVHHIRIIPLEGKPVKIHPGLQDITQFTEMVKAFVYPILLPKLTNAFSEGSWIEFGPVAMCKKGIHIHDNRDSVLGLVEYLFSGDGKGQTFAWKDIGNISVVKGSLVIEPKSSDKLQLGVARIPNLELLLTLVQFGENAS